MNDSLNLAWLKENSSTSFNLERKNRFDQPFGNYYDVKKMLTSNSYFASTQVSLYVNSWSILLLFL